MYRCGGRRQRIGEEGRESQREHHPREDREGRRELKGNEIGKEKRRNSKATVSL